MNKSSMKATIYALFLGCSSCAIQAQPINYYGQSENFDSSLGYLLHGEYVDDRGGGKYCFNEVLSAIPGGPTTAQMLAMFNSNVVEGTDGKVFALNYEGDTGGFPQGTQTIETKGLYEVIDIDPERRSACVEYRLLFPDSSIGQIVHAGDTQGAIEIVGVDEVTKKIWGYYQDVGVWKRVKCSESATWGIAMVGSLANTIKDDGRISGISGLHPDGRRISLYGKFGWSRSDDMMCASRPAGIGNWKGKWSPFRGTYCPDKDDKQLVKRTWHSKADGGSVVTDVATWEPARIITRLSHNSNIFGISTEGNLLSLVNDGENILSVPIRPSLLGDIHAIGGIGDNEEEGIFVISGKKLYNVYRDGGTCDALSYNWKALEVSIDYFEGCNRSIVMFFGNHNGMAYFMYGYPPVSYKSCPYYNDGLYTLYRLVGNGAEVVQYGRMDASLF